MGWAARDQLAGTKPASPVQSLHFATFNCYQVLSTPHASLPARLGQSAVAQPSCGGGHRLDRGVVLLRLARQPPRQARRCRAESQGRRRRAVGRARRWLLQPAEIHGRPRRSAPAPALVLLGKLLDLDERLRAVRGAVSVQRQHLFDRHPGARVGCAGCHRERLGLPRRRLVGLRPDLPPFRPHRRRPDRQ